AGLGLGRAMPPARGVPSWSLVLLVLIKGAAVAVAVIFGGRPAHGAGEGVAFRCAVGDRGVVDGHLGGGHLGGGGLVEATGDALAAPSRVDPDVQDLAPLDGDVQLADDLAALAGFPDVGDRVGVAVLAGAVGDCLR